MNQGRQNAWIDSSSTRLLVNNCNKLPCNRAATTFFHCKMKVSSFIREDLPDAEGRWRKHVCSLGLCHFDSHQLVDSCWLPDLPCPPSPSGKVARESNLVPRLRGPLDPYVNCSALTSTGPSWILASNSSGELLSAFCPRSAPQMLEGSEESHEVEVSPQFMKKITKVWQVGWFSGHQVWSFKTARYPSIFQAFAAGILFVSPDGPSQPGPSPTCFDNSCDS